MKTNINYWNHESAIIDDGATLGEGTKVWHFSHVCSGATIGDRCSLGQNVFVGNRVVIGNRRKIQNKVSVYDNVTLEDDVFCGPSMVFKMSTIQGLQSYAKKNTALPWSAKEQPWEPIALWSVGSQLDTMPSLVQGGGQQKCARLCTDG